MPMKPRVYPGCYAIMVAALVGEGISLVLTADTEGQVEPCRDCPGQPGLGGLARRATLIAQLRQAYPSLLLVDAGNALFGAESLESQGRVIMAAYQALGYDAINLSYRDSAAARPPPSCCCRTPPSPCSPPTCWTPIPDALWFSPMSSNRWQVSASP